jgi:site-specific DNA-methyltransferase (adenine-specific)
MTVDIKLHLGDSLEYMRSLPDEVVDCIFTDPPYASLEKHRNVGSTTRLSISSQSSNSWFSIITNEALPPYFEQMFRILKPGRHLYCMVDPETSYVVKPILDAVGFHWGNRLIWDKVHAGMGYHYRRRYEDILFYWKGPKTAKRQVVSRSISDVISVPRVRGQYPTEKPVKLIEVCLGQSTQQGEVVLDPFMGSGSTGDAAVGIGRSFWGCDLSPVSLEMATKRLRTTFR